MPDEMTPPYDKFVKHIIDNEQNDRLLEWGCKLFYFDRRKCLQLVNFASKLTIILVDIRVDELKSLGQYICHYLEEIYKEDKEMLFAMDKMFKKYPISCLSKLTDKSAIATLNMTQRSYLEDGYRLVDYIKDGILHTVELNKDVNFKNWIFSRKIDGKTDYFFSGKLFREMVINRFGEK